MKITFIMLGIILLVGCQHQRDSNKKNLKISKNGRYIENGQGKPFLYLGCTAWELFHRLNREEANAYLENRRENDSTHIRAAVASDGSYLITYLSIGQPVTILMKKITGTKVKAMWFDPREGKAIEIGEFGNEGFRTFIPPSAGKDNDWILVIDDLSRDLSIL